MRIFPRFFPEKSVHFKCAQEKIVYENLKRTLLDGDYTVFYSVPWWVKSVDGVFLREREADFVLIHPLHGLLLVEVKGGQIKNDYSGFLRQRPDGSWEPADNPTIQVRENYYSLTDALKKYPGVPSYLKGCYALVFPDMSSVMGGLGPVIDKDSTFFDRDIETLGEKLDQLFQRRGMMSKGKAGLGIEAAERLVQYLLPFQVAEPKLSDMLIDKEKEIRKLTQRQGKLLMVMENISHALFSGGAGTGKTYLAVEKAQRMARSGAKTLLTCFNRPLAVELEKEYAVKRLTIANFHHYCWQSACRQGLRWCGKEVLPDPDGPEKQKLGMEYFNDFLPLALLKGANLAQEQFDAIIVDEGQDFDATWIHGLKGLLKDQEKGVFYIFYDDNQNLWRKEFCAPTGMPVYQLHENLRNARHVFETFNPLYRGLEMNPGGPEGGIAEFIQVDATSFVAISDALFGLIQRLLEREGLKPHQIAILSGVSMRHSVLGFCQAVPEGIVCESVMRFKGLEKPVVILIEMDPWFDEGMRALYGSMFANITEPEKSARSMLYVGLSRARTHLYVIGGKRVMQQMRKRN